MNLREFPLTALYGGACDGYVSGLVGVCALFSPNKVLRFHTLHTHSFFFICHLHQCNNFFMLGKAVNLREFPLKALNAVACDG